MRNAVRVTATPSSPPRSADPAAAAETVVEGDWEGERLGVPDGVSCELGEELSLLDPEPDELCVRLCVSVIVRLADSLGVALAEVVSVERGGAVPDDMALRDKVPTTLCVIDSVTEPVSDGERDVVGERVVVVDPLRLPVLVKLGLLEPVSIWRGLREDAWLALRVVEGLPESA